jgi:hypothetical protein
MSRGMRWNVRVTLMGQMRNTYKIVIFKDEEKKLPCRKGADENRILK